MDLIEENEKLRWERDHLLITYKQIKENYE